MGDAARPLERSVIVPQLQHGRVGLIEPTFGRGTARLGLDAPRARASGKRLSRNHFTRRRGECATDGDAPLSSMTLDTPAVPAVNLGLMRCLDGGRCPIALLALAAGCLNVRRWVAVRASNPSRNTEHGDYTDAMPYWHRGLCPVR